MSEPRVDADLVHRVYGLLEARAWDDLRPLLADDLLYDVPQTRERVRGADAWLRFCAEFPGDWHLAVDRVVVDPATGEAAIVVRALQDDEELANLAFLRFDDFGRLVSLVDWWPEPYDPPPGRPPVVERS